jgi:hypothetical protein
MEQCSVSKIASILSCYHGRSAIQNLTIELFKFIKISAQIITNNFSKIRQNEK